MKFEPIPLEVKKFESILAPEGFYEIEVKKCVEINKGDGPYLQLTLLVHSGFQDHYINGFLNPGKNNLRNFCEYMDLIDKYNLGEITPEDCIHKKGYAKIIIYNHHKLGAINNVQFYCSKMQFEREKHVVNSKPINADPLHQNWVQDFKKENVAFKDDESIPF